MPHKMSILHNDPREEMKSSVGEESGEGESYAYKIHLSSSKYKGQDLT